MEKVTNAFTDKDMSEMILKLKDIVELSLNSAKRIDRSAIRDTTRVARWSCLVEATQSCLVVGALAEGVLSKLMDGKSELDW